MIKLTNMMVEEVIAYLECEHGDYPDELYAFYYRCMKAGMCSADADRYAILNTLFGYDIGMENAMKIDTWMYEHDEEIYELNKNDKPLLMLAVKKLGIEVNFDKWIEEDYTEYKFFED